MLFFGVVGLWSDSMDTLIITLLAVVHLHRGRHPARHLDGPQQGRVDRRHAGPRHHADASRRSATWPRSRCFFGIGLGVRGRAHGHLRAAADRADHRARHPLGLPDHAVEAARSLGLTRGQMLRQVQLPMARRTIVVGINQCMMAALSMATIAALVNGPGLGKPVVAALQILNVGAASVAGLAIVVMAIMLDRTTTAASERSRGRTNVGSASGMGVMLTGVVLERLPRWATEDAGRGQRLPRRHAGRPLAAAGAAAHPGDRLRLALPPAAATSPSSPTSATRRS